jgi:GT2 family glycosyltransferase/glycosyltransferase involved in cell wall biosynthesis
MELVSSGEAATVELRSHRRRIPAGSCLLTLRVPPPRQTTELRLLYRRPGKPDHLLGHELVIDRGQTRVHHLVVIPEDATALFLRATGPTGLPAIDRVNVTEVGPGFLLALLSARWLGRQVRHPRRLGPKLANLVRVLRREGIRGAVAGLVASQTARQGSPVTSESVAPPWELQDHLPEVDSKRAFDKECRLELEDFLATGGALEILSARDPAVSVVIVTFNRADLVLHCLRSVARHATGSVEVIVVDNASTDETGALLDRVRGATVLRNATNAGFLQGCNQGVDRARGRHVLLLNSDAFLLPGSLHAALERLEADPKVGVVGGPIVALDGGLQEAGNILWSDGSGQGYGRGDPPGRPEYRFRREVDYVSGAFLLTRLELWRKLEGFDRAYAPAYYEDVDYCLRAREAGFKVVYEPLAAVVHYEYGSTTGAAAAASAMATRRQVLRSRQGARLARQPRPDRDSVLTARSAERRERVLVIDDRVPLSVMGSGSPRMNAIVRGIVDLGREVTFYPGLPFPGTWQDVYSEVPREVEVMLGRDRDGLGRFLEERRGHYHHVIVSRAHNLVIIRDLLQRDPDILGSATLIYDAEAIAAMRTLRQPRAEQSDAEEARRLVRAEADLAAVAHRVASVSEGEAEVFRRAGVGDVHLLPHAVDLRPTYSPFGERRHLLFVGRLSEDLSPNVDGLRWFVDEVWPRIRRELASQGPPDLVVAGRVSPTVAALSAPGLRLLGAVEDLTPLFDDARIFVAPLRFSAGIPLKIMEAASFGVPVVTTDLLCAQLGWTSGRELLAVPVGDAEAFARNCIALYRDELLWTDLRTRALDRMSATATRERFGERLALLLGPGGNDEDRVEHPLGKSYERFVEE